MFYNLKRTNNECTGRFCCPKYQKLTLSFQNYLPLSKTISYPRWVPAQSAPFGDCPISYFYCWRLLSSGLCLQLQGHGLLPLHTAITSMAWCPSWKVLCRVFIPLLANAPVLSIADAFLTPSFLLYLLGGLVLWEPSFLLPSLFPFLPPISMQFGKFI